MPVSRRGRGRLWLVVLILLGVPAYFLAPRFEWHAPRITLEPDNGYLGSAPLTLTVRERGRGLKRVAVTLTRAGRSVTLLAKDYRGRQTEDRIALRPAQLRERLGEGPALLVVTARDRSLWGWGQGNQGRLERRVTVDLTPPRLALVHEPYYVNLGGSGLVIYRASDAQASELRLAGRVFPAVGGWQGDAGTFVAVFAHPVDAPADARPEIVARDTAGNLSRLAVQYRLKPRAYRRRTIQVSDGFIRRKVLPLAGDAASAGDLGRAFLAVNRDLRAADEARIRELTSRGSAEKLWQGAFLQLPNSKVEARFADHRRYLYGGREIDQAWHMGYDLASTRRVPVPAASTGRVVFAGPLGIYGNTVILDHGLGVHSLYAHLSAWTVEAGQQVARGQVIGRSGETGLAGGDHLHFGVYVWGVPVLPVEWWDPHWMHDNLEGPLAAVATLGPPADSSPGPVERP